MESVILPLQVRDLIKSLLSLYFPVETVPKAQHVSPECNRSWLPVRPVIIFVKVLWMMSFRFFAAYSDRLQFKACFDSYRILDTSQQ